METKKLKLKVKLLNSKAKLPTKSHPNDAGFDLYSTESGLITPRHVISIGTGVSVVIPKGFFGLIKPRSGMSFKSGVGALAGVVDSDFRGEVKVALTSTHLAKFEVGDRIAQLVIIPIPDIQVVEIKALPKTKRGKKGLGSSGK